VLEISTIARRSDASSSATRGRAKIAPTRSSSRADASEETARVKRSVSCCDLVSRMEAPVFGEEASW